MEDHPIKILVMLFYWSGNIKKETPNYLNIRAKKIFNWLRLKE